ncbi:hypothetical protein BD410DRAFT_491598 [Rickenella mellea]|uniref:Uncharacterized protein n=1 Tax=Rickenella mellea TaxID=50990 RepID=A0A4Y7PVR3_9AGAM|nr:hypothetical protein BD410DRAFT_491598 [Rickenella mellea]
MWEMGQTPIASKLLPNGDAADLEYHPPSANARSPELKRPPSLCHTRLVSLHILPLAFICWGIRIKDNGVRFTAKQLVASEEVIERKLKPLKGSKLWTRVYPDIPVCVKVWTRPLREIAYSPKWVWSPFGAWATSLFGVRRWCGAARMSAWMGLVAATREEHVVT